MVQNMKIITQQHKLDLEPVRNELTKFISKMVF